MSGRELVMQDLKRRMEGAFGKGEVADAQNIEAFLTTVEGLSDQQFDHLSTPTPQEAETQGVIS